MDIAALPPGTEIVARPMADKTELCRLGYFPRKSLPGGDELWFRQTGPLSVRGIPMERMSSQVGVPENVRAIFPALELPERIAFADLEAAAHLIIEWEHGDGEDSRALIVAAKTLDVA